YGSKWYSYFFNINHIQYSIEKLNENKKKYKELEDIYGNKWIETFINENKKTKKILYSFENIIKQKNRFKYSNLQLDNKIINNYKIKNSEIFFNNKIKGSETYFNNTIK